MSYYYLKTTNKAKPQLISSVKRKIFAGLFFAIGLVFLGSAVWPILQFQLFYSFQFSQLLNPLSIKNYNQTGVVLGDSTDYTQLNNWFVSPDSSNNLLPVVSPDGIITYKLSIPKLKITDAVVTLGSMDLKKSLIQYPKTSLPGQAGNPVIFGHSVLPQFFNAKSYLAIFSTLYTLKPDDDIIIKYDNVTYNYKVQEMFEIKPTELSVLDQRLDGRYLTLITCSPPGTVLRRLVIKAKIADN